MSGLDELDQAERREWSDKDGGLTLIRVPPRVCIIKPEGRAGEGATNFWREHNDWLTCEHMFMFFDGGELGFAGTAFISAGSSLTIDARPRMAGYHVLVANVMIEMIAKTINMSLGGFMKIHREREPFDAAIAHALELQKTS